MLTELLTTHGLAGQFAIEKTREAYNATSGAVLTNQRNSTSCEKRQVALHILARCTYLGQVENVILMRNLICHSIG